MIENCSICDKDYNTLTMNGKPLCVDCIEIRLACIDDLCMLLRRVCFGNGGDINDKALDYLKRNGLFGSPLRKDGCEDHNTCTACQDTNCSSNVKNINKGITKDE